MSEATCYRCKHCNLCYLRDRAEEFARHQNVRDCPLGVNFNGKLFALLGTCCLLYTPESRTVEVDHDHSQEL